MKDIRRRDEAKKTAERYAPNPQSTALVYGFVAVCIGGLALIAFGRFYSVDVLQYPLFLVPASLAIFAAGMLFQRIRSRRHKQAHRAEYRKSEPPQP